MERAMDKLYIIIPAYNEEENVKEVIEEWYPVLERCGEDSRLVIINDGSKDATFSIMQECAKEYPRFIPLTKSNGGHGSAVLFGYRYAIENGADYIFQTDSDRQTNPDEFEQFWNCRDKYDAVIGNRVDRGDGKNRKFVEHTVCFLLRIIFGVKVSDANAPFRLMKAELVKKYIEKLPEDFNIPNIMFTTYFVYNNEKVRFIPITFKPRQGGTNSINIKKIVKIGWNAIGDFRKLKKEMDDCKNVGYRTQKKVVIITNAPAPYRVDFFKYIQEREKEFTFTVIYASQNSDIGRHWVIPEADLMKHHFLERKVFTIKRKYDDKRIVITYGVRRLLNELNPDIVICMEYNLTIIQAVQWCLRHKIPYISWSDGTARSERGINRLQKQFRKYVIGHAAGLISSSTETRKHQMSYGAPKQKCHLSLLTVNTEKYRYRKPETDMDEPASDGKLLYVGSLIGRKGVDLLLQAFAKTTQPVSLVIVGEGSEERELRKLAADLGIADRIQWKGYLEGRELEQCYRECDAFVLPTREDCYGLVLLEALCSSLPVIASKYADGAKDLIEDGKQGIIVDPENEAAFAGAIDCLFEDRRVLKQMQTAAYERSFYFDFDRVVNGFMKALRDVCRV
jgi:glycosyltransferase involved in cell wall biosynthesis